MKDFFKKYKIQFKGLEILILIILVYSRFERFFNSNRQMNLITGIVFLILLIVRMYEFFKLVKELKAEKK